MDTYGLIGYKLGDWSSRPWKVVVSIVFVVPSKVPGPFGTYTRLLYSHHLLLIIDNADSSVKDTSRPQGTTLEPA